ncbi:MAG: hypothetical protein AAB254_05985 [candidate division NC10 bacterium]
MAGRAPREAAAPPTRLVFTGAPPVPAPAMATPSPLVIRIVISRRLDIPWGPTRGGQRGRRPDEAATGLIS